MLGLNRSPGMGHVSSETDREDSPPPAPDVTAPLAITHFCMNVSRQPPTYCSDYFINNARLLDRLSSHNHGQRS
ncbi:hypothetical protein TNCV_2952761 [Trichonephila clavipes]|nr:hypothetical protein TNCV_2952761 [Trichonephila clavipes]